MHLRDALREVERHVVHLRVDSLACRAGRANVSLQRSLCWQCGLVRLAGLGWAARATRLARTARRGTVVSGLFVRWQANRRRRQVGNSSVFIYISLLLLQD